jgi:two-component system, NtrC family, response regulator AtoC
VQNSKSILIVDDDKMLFEAIQGLLEEYGHVVSCCDNGLDAIMLAREHDFDMILTDYNMPVIKGDVVCRLIRNHRPHAYIVGFSIESKHRDFINAGANKFIYKDELLKNLSLLHELVQMTP